MVTTTRRTGEKGQRTARSTDVYQVRGTARGVMSCSSCRSIYRNKRWYPDDGTMRGQTPASLTCPACRRIADKNPAGIVTLRGPYLATHESEISNLIKHAELSAHANNPLGRIMTTSKEGGGIIITTTEGKLAQKIGREIFKAHGGELNYQWSHGEELVRVNWSR